jgi:hypothetical protein
MQRQMIIKRNFLYIINSITKLKSRWKDEHILHSHKNLVQNFSFMCIIRHPCIPLKILLGSLYGWMHQKISLEHIPCTKWMKIFVWHNLQLNEWMKTRGMSHCGLAIYIKKYLKSQKDLWKFKYFTMQKKNPLKETKILQDIITQ